MSKAQEFMDRVRSDEALREQLKGLGQNMQAILDLAERQGYSFTQAEFEAALRDRGYEVGTELSEQELAQVAGGMDAGSAGVTYCGENTCGCTQWPNC